MLDVAIFTALGWERRAVTAGLAEPIAAWGAARGRRLHVGPVLSAPNVFTSGSNGERGDALAVEMEHAGVAAEALARGIPFVGLRVILDREDQAVPFVDTVDEVTGELRTGRTITTLALRPWLWRAAARLAWLAGAADRELRKEMSELTRTGSTALGGCAP